MNLPRISGLSLLLQVAGRIFSVLLLICTTTVSAHQRHPNGELQLDWHADQISSVTAIDTNGRAGDYIFRLTDAARVENRAGKECAVGAYLMFDVEDSFAFNIDETVTVEVLLDSEVSNGLAYYYDRAELGPKVEMVRFSDNEERWQTVTLELQSARFANRLLTSADLGLVSLVSANALAAQGGDTREIAVCGINLKRENKPALHGGPRGTLELAIHDGSGGPLTPARVGLYDAHGRLPLPSESALKFRRWENEWIDQEQMFPGVENWPYSGRYAFYLDGEYEAELEAGTYDLVIGKGPEYRIVQRQVEIKAGERTRLALALERWIDMPAQGWYSADDHIHFKRSREDNEWVSALARAEDLHVANILQMGNLGGYFFSQYSFGEEGQYLSGNHALVSGQESPRTPQLGHTISLNGKEYYNSPDYFLYHKTAEAVRKDGGFFGYAHLAIGTMAKVLHADAGMALDLTSGLVDFAEILQSGRMDPSILYDFLNLGFKLNPSAGSDWPYLGLPGSERFYVQLEEAFSPRAFFDGMRAGRIFVTNGPMLELDVAGEPMGGEVQIKQGETIKITAKARQNPDYGNLDRLELVVHGEVVKAVESQPGAETLELIHELRPQNSHWLAIRAYGKEMGLSHSAPVYVYVGGQNRTWKQDAVPELVARYKSALEGILTMEPDWVYQTEKDSVSPELLHLQWKGQKETLTHRIKSAIAFYENMAAEASR